MAKISGKGKLLRVYIDEKDQWQGMPLHQCILEEVKNADLAGATVIKGHDGFGASSRDNTTNLFGGRVENPIIIEIIDSIDYINSFMPTLEKMVKQGLISIMDVEILKYT
jgi:uncharacterized protein